MMQKLGGAWWHLSEWEFREAVKRTRAALRLPHGQRSEALRRVAVDYGICERTLRRWLTYDVKALRIGSYEALFVLKNGKPSQVTPWEKAA